MVSWTPWVVLALASGIAVLALLAWRHPAPFGPELRVRDVLENDADSSPWTVAARASVPLSAAALAVVMIWTFSRGWYRAVLLCAAVPATIGIVELVVKPLVGRRGQSGGLSFPSGHVALVAATVTVVVVAAELRLRGRSIQVVALSGGGAAFVGIVSTVIALEWHWPIDALAGLATGVVCSLGWCLVLDVAARRLVMTGSPPSSGGGHDRTRSLRAVGVRRP